MLYVAFSRIDEGIRCFASLRLVGRRRCSPRGRGRINR